MQSSLRQGEVRRFPEQHDDVSDLEAVGNADSVLEAMCTSPRGENRLQLVRQLTGMALNCVISEFGPDCGSNPGLSDLYNTCNDACINNTADDRTITVFETGVPPDMTDYYLTNKAIGDTYDTVEFGVTKRMSDHWQLIGGFDWTKRNLSSLFSEDPNNVFWNATNTQTTGWTFKASGSYVFKKGVMVALSYNAMKGEPYARFFTITPEYLTLADPNRTASLVQGNMTIVAEKAGTYYLPAINLINIRVQKEFVIRNTQRLHLMFNIFNFADARTVTAVNWLTGPAFNQPGDTLDGTVVRFSLRYMF
jgi:hypothetical protein